MIFDFLLDKAFILPSEQGVTVSFSHWTKKRKSFFISWNGITNIVLYYNEPAIFELHIHTDGGQDFLIDETMNGWTDFLNSAHCRLRGFSVSKSEISSLNVYDRIVCYSKNEDV